MKDWAKRFYALDENFPEAASIDSGKERWNKVLELNPSLGEFSRTLPTVEEVANNRDKLIQSEFKKPYNAEHYSDMEYSSSGEPGKPPDVPEPEFKFSVETGRGCPSEVMQFVFKFSHLCTSLVFSIPNDNPDYLIEQLTPGSFQICLIYIPPGEFDQNFQFQATQIDKATGKTSILKSELLTTESSGSYKCPSLYGEFEVSTRQVNTFFYRYIVWDFTRNEIAQNVPKPSGGTVVFPCIESDLSIFRSKMEVESTIPFLNTFAFEGVYPDDPAEFSPPSLPIPVFNPGGFLWNMTAVSHRRSDDNTQWYGSETTWNYAFTFGTCVTGGTGYERVDRTSLIPSSIENDGMNGIFNWGIDVDQGDLELACMIEITQLHNRLIQPSCSSYGCDYVLERKAYITEAFVNGDSWFSSIGQNMDGFAICEQEDSKMTEVSDVNYARLNQGLPLTSDAGIFIMSMGFIEYQFTLTALSLYDQFPDGAYPTVTKPQYYDRDCSGGRNWWCETEYAPYKTPYANNIELFISTWWSDTGLLYLDGADVKTLTDMNSLTRNAVLEAELLATIALNPPDSILGYWDIAFQMYRGAYG